MVERFDEESVELWPKRNREIWSEQPKSSLDSWAKVIEVDSEDHIVAAEWRTGESKDPYATTLYLKDPKKDITARIGGELCYDQALISAVQVHYGGMRGWAPGKTLRIGGRKVDGQPIYTDIPIPYGYSEKEALEAFGPKDLVEASPMGREWFDGGRNSEVKKAIDKFSRGELTHAQLKKILVDNELEYPPIKTE